MKESAFRTAVLSKLPTFIHRQPMLASFSSYPGTPDTYLDYSTDLWVEFKVMRTDDHLPIRIPKDALPTAEQDRWLTRRWDASRNAVVIVGIKLKRRSYGLILDRPEQWRGPVERSFYEPRLLDAKGLANALFLRMA